jgi:enoyl-CoA hydratase
MSLVELRAESGVAILTLNRPEKRNAMTHEMQAELAGLLRDVEADDWIRAVVITGAGADFCVGGDFDTVDRMRADSAHQAELVRFHTDIAECILSFAKPTIAAVQGRAFGFGAELAAFCDMVVMSENARFADPHVKMGLPPAPGALLIWPQRTSRAIAAELMLTGREVRADEALRLGLCNRVAPEGEELAGALVLARTLCELPREGVMAVKAALRQSYKALLAAAQGTPQGS